MRKVVEHLTGFVKAKTVEAWVSVWLFIVTITVLGFSLVWLFHQVQIAARTW